MITKEKLQTEIEQLKSAPMTGDNCSDLAALLIIKEHLFDKEPQKTHDVAKNEPQSDLNNKPITIYSEASNPFLTAINGKEMEHLIPIFDELMSSIKILYPKVYQKTLTQIINL
jgi:hypothetical protein